MPVQKRTHEYFDTADGQVIKQKLQLMAENSLFNTTSTYSTNSSLYPDNKIPFLEKHMNYIVAHPGLDPQVYVANLRLMTRRRP